MDLNPIPDTDRDLFGLKQSSEEESLESASDSEDSGSGRRPKGGYRDFGIRRKRTSHRGVAAGDQTSTQGATS